VSDAAASMSCCAPGPRIPALPPRTSWIALSRWSRWRGSSETFRGSAIHLGFPSRRADHDGLLQAARCFADVPPNKPPDGLVELYRGGEYTIADILEGPYDLAIHRVTHGPSCWRSGRAALGQGLVATPSVVSPTGARHGKHAPGAGEQPWPHPDLLCDHHRHPRAGADSPPMRGTQDNAAVLQRRRCVGNGRRGRLRGAHALSRESARQ